MSVPDFKLDIKTDPNLYDNTAYEIAKCLVGRNDRGNRIVGVTRSQLRKIFDETKSLKKRIGQLDDSEAWSNIYPMVKMIKAKTAYLFARAQRERRDSKNYYKNLLEFIQKGIDQIKNPEDFNIFCLLFEAVYGYYYELGGVSV